MYHTPNYGARLSDTDLIYQYANNDVWLHIIKWRSVASWMQNKDFSGTSWISLYSTSTCVPRGLGFRVLSNTFADPVSAIFELSSTLSIQIPWDFMEEFIWLAGKRYSLPWISIFWILRPRTGNIVSLDNVKLFRIFVIGYCPIAFLSYEL